MNPVKKTYHSHNPSKGEYNSSISKAHQMRNSLAETAKKQPKVIQQKSNGAYAAYPHRMVSDSEKKRVMGFDSVNLSQSSKMSNNQDQNNTNDVMLKDLLEVPDPIKLESPLPMLSTEEQHHRKIEVEQVEATGFANADNCYQL